MLKRIGSIWSNSWIKSVFPNLNESSIVLVNLVSYWFKISIYLISLRSFLSHSVAYVLGSINREVLNELAIITEFSKVRESPGRPIDFHFKILLSVVIKLSKSNLVFLISYFQSFLFFSLKFSSASARYTTKAADNKESNGNFLNSSSIHLVYSIHLIFSPPNFVRRFLANCNVSFVFLRSDFKLSASYVLVENWLLSSSTLPLRALSYASHSFNL